MSCPELSALQAHIEGLATPEVREEIHAHLAYCAVCCQLVLRLAPTPQTDTPGLLNGRAGVVAEPGDRIGRYVVLRKLGEGGMGIVYGAYDPELDRQIALKLLRPARGEPTPRQEQERLVREGQAMARIAHPNVTTVFDVGRHGEQVFVAMELIIGETLGTWLARERAISEIVEVFVRAGRGLAAAHAAGLVHRDFKPNNVMIDAEGRVRVTDFGVARLGDPSDRPRSPASPSALSQIDLALTATGTLLGTPSYMPPEQLACEPTDARSDQFSFCVALYEALCGTRPFVAEDTDKLRAKILAHEMQTPARRVPRWLLSTVTRGLSASPAERWPSMDELLAALLRNPWRRRGRAALVVGILCALGAAGIVYRAPSAACRGFERNLVGVWDPARKSAVERAFKKTRLRDEAATFAAVASLLDRYAASWVEARTDACRARRSRGELNEDVSDLRMICLEDRRDEVAALTELFTRADADLVRRARDEAASLPSIAGCTDVTALREREAPPSDPLLRERQAELQTRMSRVITLRAAGKHEDAFAEAQALLRDATALGYRSMIAEASYFVALESQGRHQYADTERRFVVEARNAPWVERHDLTATQLQAELDVRVAAGYRLTYLNGYAVGAQAKYAAIWARYAGPKQVVQYGMTAQQYQAAFDAQVAAGYGLALVNGYTVNDVDYYVALWDQAPRGTWISRYGMSAAEYQSVFDAHVAAGYRLTHLSGYGGSGGEKYAAIWEQKSGSRWIARHGLNSAEFQAEFDAQFLAGYHLTLIGSYPAGNGVHFLGIWEQGGVSRWWHAETGLEVDDFEQTSKDLRYRGHRPISVSAHTDAGGTRYTALWRNYSMSKDDLNTMDWIVDERMAKAKAPGFSLAITQGGRLIFARAYGYSDPETKTPINTSNLFRIGGISKWITAAAILTLVERGKLGLDDKVFGKTALLGTSYGSRSYGEWLRQITVRHLLTQTAGGWEEHEPGPMLEDPSLSQSELISWTIDHVPLTHGPGTTYAESSFGYYLLGRIIEKVTGQPYDAWVKANILSPAGIHDMRIAGNTLAARAPKEVVYVDTKHPSAPYAMNVARMDSADGWIATPIDLVRLSVRLDGFAKPPDLLGAASLTLQTTPTAASIRAGHPYGLGCAIAASPDANGLSPTPAKNTWWHGGTLDGSTAIVVRTEGEFTWAVAMNSTDADMNIDSMMWEILGSVAAWPSHDLFANP
jgi:CubicO group peptidase (beta-lactamase class C family)